MPFYQALAKGQDALKLHEKLARTNPQLVGLEIGPDGKPRHPLTLPYPLLPARATATVLGGASRASLQPRPASSGSGARSGSGRPSLAQQKQQPYGALQERIGNATLPDLLSRLERDSLFGYERRFAGLQAITNFEHRFYAGSSSTRGLLKGLIQAVVDSFKRAAFVPTPAATRVSERTAGRRASSFTGSYTGSSSSSSSSARSGGGVVGGSSEPQAEQLSGSSSGVGSAASEPSSESRLSEFCAAEGEVARFRGVPEGSKKKDLAQAFFAVLDKVR